MKKINKLLLFLVICIAVVFFIAYFYYYENAKNQYVPEDNEIKVIDAFFKIEGGFTRTSVKYPVICPESDKVQVDLPVTKDSQDEIIGEFIKLFESSLFLNL